MMNSGAFIILYTTHAQENLCPVYVVGETTPRAIVRTMDYV